MCVLGEVKWEVAFFCFAPQTPLALLASGGELQEVFGGLWA